ncbi:MAG TPA: patatin-like phospholipase family protein [Thermoanaerobaculia bacterium]|nr:patatin-like phospholipase family protein [Thermoanaerobaculia bacterium]
MSASPPEVGRPGAVPRRPRVAVVIGSGSVKCAAAIGLLKVLQREGIGIDLLVGCSGGSIYAALIALGYEPARTEEMTRKLWTKELTSRRNRVAFLRAFLPFVPFHERFGLVSDRLIMDRLRTAFGDATFEQARIPLFLTATDFHNGEQVVFAKGAIVDALRASIAIPYVFEPWPVDDRLLVDGFLSDPMPVGVAIKEGADVIVTMGFESPYQSKVTSLLRFAFQLSSITSNNLLRANYSFHNLAHHHEIIPIVPQFKERVGLFDTHKIPYVIEEGERAAQEKLPYIRRLLAATDA